MNTVKQRHTWIPALIVGALIAGTTGALYARDRGVNQAGAAGNAATDPGVNQPGKAGNAQAGKKHKPGRGIRRDRGANQPGVAGNVGAAPPVDAGRNQPGRVGGGAGR